MTKPGDSDAHAATLAASSREDTLAAPSSPGTDPTLAAGSAGPLSTDDTLAAASAGQATTGLPEVPRNLYEVGAELARGGMGRILVARDRRIGRPVALKELLHGGGDGMTRRFEREALVTGRLQHPAIVPVYEAGRWPSGEPFYAMKLVTGKSLEKVISEKPAFVDRLALLSTLIHIAEAMAYAHSQHVIHRDLKPANVLVGAFGETVVIDWGLAKDLSEVSDEPELAAGPYRKPAASGELTVMGSVMGTPVYMPPEQAAGEPLDERADVYALGAILYHVLAGRPPYTGQSAEHILGQVAERPPPPIATVEPGVPEELATIVGKAMARAPADRYRTAKELAEELVRFQAGQLVSAHRYSAWALVRRFVRRHRAAVLAAAALVVVGGTIGAFSVHKVIEARDRAQAARDLAAAQQLAALQDQGEKELLGSRFGRAAVLFDQAYRQGEPSDALRLLLAEALWPLESAVASVNSGAPIEQVVFAADGRFATTDGAGGIAIWDGQGKPVAKLDVRGQPIEALAFSPDGHRLASARLETVIWDASSGHQLVRIDAVGKLAFSPDGQRLLIVSDTVTAWQVATGTRLAASEALAANDARFTPAGIVVTTDPAGFVLLDGTTLATLGRRELGDKSALSEVAPSGSVLIGGDAATVYDGEHPDAAGWPIKGGELRHASFDGSGQSLLVTPVDGDLELFAEGAWAASFPAGLGLATLSPDGSKVAIAGQGGSVSLWNADGSFAGALAGHRREIHALAFSPDGHTLVSAGEDGAKLWRVRSGPTRMIARDATIDEAAIAPDGSRFVAVGDRDGFVANAAGEITTHFPPSAAETLWSADFSPDGSRVVVTSSARRIDVRDAATMKVVTTIRDLAFAARFSPDGTQLVSAGGEDANVWDARTGARVATLAGHDDIVSTARFSPDGTRVVTACRDGKARVFEVRTGKLLATLSGHAAYLTDARFDPGGTRILTASGDGTGGLWDAGTGLRRATLGGHNGVVRAASFAPDGSRILTVAGTDVRVWDGVTGALVVALEGHGARVEDAVFAGDGTRVAAIDADSVLALWDVQAGARLFESPVEHSPAQPQPAIPDPRSPGGRLTMAPDGSWVLVSSGRHLVVRALPRERRSSAELMALVARISGWRYAGGHVVPAQDPASYRTDETAHMMARVLTYDFSDDAVEGDWLRPGVVWAIPLPKGDPLPGVPWPSTPEERRALLPRIQAVADAPGATEAQIELAALADLALGASPAAAPELDRLLASFPSSPDLAARRIRRAFLALDEKDGLAVARKLTADLPAAPVLEPERLYELAWIRYHTGDTGDAYRTLLLAAGHWRSGSARSLAQELIELAVRAGVRPDELEKALAETGANAGTSRVSLLERMADAYTSAGELELADQALASLAAVAPPELRADVKLRQARSAGDSGRVGEAATLVLEALAMVDGGAPLSADARKQVVNALVSFATVWHSSYRKTFDERYARAAARLYTALLSRPRANVERPAIERYLADLDQGVAEGPGWTDHSLDKGLIRRGIRTRVPKIQRCYERELRADPHLEGRIALQIVLSGQGRITSVTPRPGTTDPGLARVGDCVAQEVTHAVLPHVASGGATVLTYPFVFHSAE